MDIVEGKVAVVTGGASGIGKAMAARFQAAGMHVVIADVEQGALDATSAELGVVGVRTDVSDADSVAALAAAVVERFGTAHVICNNAGVGGGGVIASQTLKDWKWIIDVNLWGVVHGLHSFLPLLLANPDGGHVVNTASMAGLSAWPGIGPYNATKYAVVGLSETLAIELAGSPVGVSVLCPGVVNTNIFTSQRNRPVALKNERPNVEARKVNGTIRISDGLEPSVVADRVLDAIVADRFWIITHPELLEAVEGRHRRLLAHESTTSSGAAAPPAPS
jgi:NAD(P)-dependent dehydrogenase (short-subunit alcohol dehydrogenase family)